MHERESQIANKIGFMDGCKFDLAFPDKRKNSRFDISYKSFSRPEFNYSFIHWELYSKYFNFFAVSLSDLYPLPDDCVDVVVPYIVTGNQRSFIYWSISLS